MLKILYPASVKNEKLFAVNLKTKFDVMEHQSELAGNSEDQFNALGYAVGFFCSMEAQAEIYQAKLQAPQS